ncbi:CHAT domain-containing protein [[Phormidium] sp. ETS-05]|uniref:CHAT domain-containing protein n=1 Tax=[Phormidium] sp. ETS-05 TaxID=222819 RepID=UPI0018EF015B|nr:CHAT domain-containing protein [[Phormidium] sp. ETS-05]
MKPVEVTGKLAVISIFIGTIGATFLPATAPAQTPPIIPETGTNSTSTLVTPEGNRLDITGGQTSRDGANLFHSFEQFGLNRDQIANFITNPQINNILGRVVGGDPSYINGLIQVTGGTSNLFLMNPAGILFGPNASLNIPADFTATTASSIGFGNNWFNGIGSNDYANLVGTPNAFTFPSTASGIILNEGNLSPGSNLNLFGSTVINTGTLSTPHGSINITAVPSDSPLDKGGQGGSILRISQPGHILSLEIENRFVGVIRESPLLPQLLTGGDSLHHATTVEKLADGTIRLTGSQTPIPIASGVAVISGNVDVGGLKPNYEPLEGLKPNYELNILGDKIALIGANINSSHINIGLETVSPSPRPEVSPSFFAATHTYIDPTTHITTGGVGGEIIIWSDNTTQFHGNITAPGAFVEISGKENLIFRGNVDVNNPNGTAGTILFDPKNITIANGGADPVATNRLFTDNRAGSVTFDADSIAGLTGNVTLEANNDININENIVTASIASLEFKAGRTIALNANIDTSGSNGNITLRANHNTADTTQRDPGPGNINMAANTILNAGTGQINLEISNLAAVGDINLANITAGDFTANANAGNIRTIAPDANITANTANLSTLGPGGIGSPTEPLRVQVNNLQATSGSGGISINATGEITLGEINSGGGGGIRITADGNIQLQGDIKTGVATGNAGNITLESINGSIDDFDSFGNISSFADTGDGGTINITAARFVDLQDIKSYGQLRGGDINVTSNSEYLYTGSILSNSDNGKAGNVTLNSGGDIQTDIIQLTGAEAGGNITLNSGGSITSGAFSSNADGTDGGGDINITATNQVKISDISVYGNSNAGQINITSSTGGIETGNIESYSQAGAGGPVSFKADSNISIFSINSAGASRGGDIILFSTNGTISATNLASSATTGTGGKIDLDASAGVTVSQLTSEGTQAGGSIRIYSVAGLVDLQNSISSFSANGTGGNIEITSAVGDINTGGTISSEGESRGGDITIKAEGGSIRTGAGFLRTVANVGEAGAVLLEAQQDIFTGEIQAFGDNAGQFSRGGPITLRSFEGKIDTTNGVINAVSGFGEGGNITIDAASDVLTGQITARGGGTFSDAKGGNITITSQRGSINAQNTLDSISEVGTAGDVTLQADGNITTNQITSNGATGGHIQITSNSGEITVNSLASYGDTRAAGDVTISALGNVTTVDINSEGFFRGGNITITSSNGEINTAAGTLRSVSDANATSPGTGGDVKLDAAGDVATGFLQSWASGNQDSRGGNIVIISRNGGIDTTVGNLTDIANVSPDTDVTQDEFANIFRDGKGNLESYAINGGGGSVTLEAKTDITTSHISSYGGVGSGSATITSSEGSINTGVVFSVATNGGASNITIAAPAGDVNVSHINSYAAQQGGHINITSGGSFNIGAATINSFSKQSVAGDITVTAAGDVNLGGDNSRSAVSSEGPQRGGNVSITSSGGAINTNRGSIDSYSENGTAGNVTLNANGDVMTTNIRSEGSQRGGDIIANSNNGLIDTTGGELRSFSDGAVAGNVSLRANGDVTTAEILSYGLEQGGGLSIISFAGEVDTTRGNMNSYSPNGVAGFASISAFGDVFVGGIRSNGYSQGGSISIGTSTGTITATRGNLDSLSDNGVAGAVTLKAPGDIMVGNIRSQGYEVGGSIEITSDAGVVDTTGGDIQSFSANGRAGNVTLNAAGHVETASILSSGRMRGGDIAITSASTDSIDTTAGSLETYSTEGSAGSITLSSPGNIMAADMRSEGATTGGSINLTSSGDIDTSGGDIDTYSEDGTAGDVTVDALGSVNVNNITSYGGENSGNVTVTSDEGSIATGTIRTIAPNGTSGNITLNTFSHNGDITTANISTEGGQAAGNITAVAPDGSITTGDISSISTAGDSGDITVAGGNDVTTGDISSVAQGDSGDITVTSTEGSVTTGDISSIAETGTAGDITVTALEDINTGNITSSGAQGSGDINVTSITGETNTGEVFTNTGEVQIISGADAISEVTPPPPPTTPPTIPQNNLPAVNNPPVLQIIPGPPPVPALLESALQDASNITNVLAGGPAAVKEQIDGIANDSSIASIAQDLAILNSNSLAVGASETLISSLDQNREQEFEDYFGQDFGKKLTSTASIREALSLIANQTGYQSAIVYVNALPDQLELIVFTPEGQPIRKTVPDAPREKLLAVATEFRSLLTSASRRNSKSYLRPAQQLYNWLIAPIEGELQAAGINTILLSMDAGLRSLPMAALHDGQQFLAEKYSTSLIPSVSLIDTNYRAIQNTRVLAMGASTFNEQKPLPAVPVELSTITKELWQGTVFMNEQFTRENLISQRQSYPYEIIHLATHGEFYPGGPDKSFIYMWGQEKLRLDQLRELKWNEPPVELLILSACRTALGDEQAEMGFAGLAVQAGVKSALASLWSVSDEGTLALMTEFYSHLQNAKIKSEALRQAQIAMIRGEVAVTDGGLRGNGIGVVTLPRASAGGANHDLSHPYYWAGFTMIGSPW